MNWFSICKLSMKRRIILAFFIVVALVSIYWVTHRNYMPLTVSYRPSDFAEVLQPIESAFDIKYCKPGVTRIVVGCQEISFLIKDTYPAIKSRNKVSELLKKYDYKILKYSIATPENLAEYTWNKIAIRQDREPEFLRLEENWSDGQNLIRATYDYRLPIGEFGNELCVQLILTDTNYWFQPLINYKKMHQTEFD